VVPSDPLPTAIGEGGELARIVQISDTHLSRHGGITAQNLTRIITFVEEVLKPDLVVHTGDIVALDPDEAADRDAAREALHSFATPVRVLPGNHDVGEAGPDPWMGLSVTSSRVAAHVATFGADHFAEELGGWRIIGLNSELLGSGLPEEEAQWAWLETQLADVQGRPVLLFLHKPLWPPRPEVTGKNRSIADQARTRLLALPGAMALRAVGSGHLHRFRRRVRPGLLEVWAPSTAYRGRAEDMAPWANGGRGVVSRAS
jgi:3',5'-cyclic AMP phosphodiesterase CpdA